MSPPSSSPSAFAALSDFFHRHAASTVSLEILPSDYPFPAGHAPPLLTDGACLAIRRRDLVCAFLEARTILLAHDDDNGDDDDADRRRSLDAATRVILFHDPEHLTAANRRKRLLLLAAAPGRLSSPPCPPSTESHDDDEDDALRRELAFLASLQTSPLHRHAKSPTLWWHRFWAVTRRHGPRACLGAGESGAGARASSSSSLLAFVHAELEVVLGAAERHGANYHAFLYGRRLVALLLGAATTTMTVRGDGNEGGQAEVGMVRRVRGWCLAHPRDVSGWAFLAFLLRRRRR